MVKGAGVWKYFIFKFQRAIF